MRKVAFLNNRGGTGKTTFAVNLAIPLSRRVKVLFIDTDVDQASGMNWLLGRGKKFNPMQIYKYEGGNMDCVNGKCSEVLKRFGNKDKYDVAVIDGRPQSSIIGDTIDCLERGDLVFCIVDMSDDTIRQAEDLMRALDKAKKEVKKRLIVNKLTQARISQKLNSKIEQMGYQIFGIVKLTEYIKIAEMGCQWVGAVRGVTRTMLKDFFESMAYWIATGEL